MKQAAEEFDAASLETFDFVQSDSDSCLWKYETRVYGNMESELGLCVYTSFETAFGKRFLSAPLLGHGDHIQPQKRNFITGPDGLH